ncbi:MAG TPA: lysine--tRNA ligase [Candidatus Saccharimonadales bacterium]|nr:lysine--tRNA ligase [Candidatus Saccharimonadales bacterium]
MQWLNRIVDEVIKRHPSGEILIESGGSPSGTYHLGHLRELVTSDAILVELKRRGREARHIYFVDDLDGLRKIPVNVPTKYEKYLGQSLCDVPAPDKSRRSYADYFLQDLVDACQTLGIEIDFIHSHEKYRSGFFTPAIERSLERIDRAKMALETLSGRSLGKEWSPIQINEDGYLKKRQFVSLDKFEKEVVYIDKSGKTQAISYAKGDVKLDWRLDWPGRWWLMKVQVEPFGRDHATKGGSYDTGVQIMKDVYFAEPPLPVPYDFINMVGDTKKMSASKGTGLDAKEGSKILPPEVIRYFILRSEPKKRLYFDPINGVVQLMDEFAALVSKPDKTPDEEQLLTICTHGQSQQTVSQVPFSHLVASYQASLRDVDKTLDVLVRTEHGVMAGVENPIIINELKFIDNWLDKQAPDDVKFELAGQVDSDSFNDQSQRFLLLLADKIEQAPTDVDGEWFHKTIYGLKDTVGLEPKQLFQILYQALINKDSGPRAGWFLSILPRDWLVKRLRLQA